MAINNLLVAQASLNRLLSKISGYIVCGILSSRNLVHQVNGGKVPKNPACIAINS